MITSHFKRPTFKRQNAETPSRKVTKLRVAKPPGNKVWDFLLKGIVTSHNSAKENVFDFLVRRKSLTCRESFYHLKIFDLICSETFFP